MKGDAIHVTASVEQRLDANVERTDNGCWVWTAAKTESGYAIIRINGKCVRAHRAQWVRHFGQVPHPNLEVMHICDRRDCINPDHLALGTHRANMLDCANKNGFAVGGKNGNATLTESAVVEMRQLRADGATLLELAQSDGVSRSTVHYACTNALWKHVGAPVSESV